MIPLNSVLRPLLGRKKVVLLAGWQNLLAIPNNNEMRCFGQQIGRGVSYY